MANAKLEKTVFIKDQYDRVLDRSFRTFLTASLEAPALGVDDLFKLYDDLFYQIPIEGDINSHTYLIKRSSELVNFERTTEDIQPLLDEIASLKDQLLLSNKKIIELETSNLQ